MGNDSVAEIAETPNPWLRADVANAQLELVTQQLADDAAGNSPPPFTAFRRAMDFLMARFHAGEVPAFLDVGCGVGHYGVLCARAEWRMSYWGTDVSVAMIERARQLRASLCPHVIDWRYNFETLAFAANPFGDFDIVFSSQTVDVTDNPVGNLRLLLAGARKYVILHRLRIPAHVQGAGMASIRVVEDTYCGHVAHNFLWNRDELMGIVGDYGRVIYADEWDKMLTLIVEKL